jgi:hypothetical protein
MARTKKKLLESQVERSLKKIRFLENPNAFGNPLGNPYRFPKRFPVSTSVFENTFLVSEGSETVKFSKIPI